MLRSSSFSSSLRPLRRALLGTSLVLVALSACECDPELALLPGSVLGTVCSVENGQAIAGVNVRIVDANGLEQTVVTDGTGSFRADDVSAGDATVFVDAPDGAREATVSVAPQGLAEWNDGQCRVVPEPPIPTGTVEGCICDESVGAWVDGADVYVQSSFGLAATGTDAFGCFVLTGVPVGEQLVRVQRGVFFREVAVTVVVDQTSAIPSPAACEPPPVVPSGSVQGRVCAPDGVTWLNDADVYVELATGGRTATETDGDGRYLLENVPAGEQQLRIEKGSFSTTITVTVVAGQTTVIPEETCALDQDLAIAVVSGQWDRVEDVLANVGVDNVDTFDGFGGGWVDALLGDYATLSQYDIVFINCGASDLSFLFDSAARANLQQFVQNGGSLYASDQAYDVVERSFPNLIEFFGNDGLGQQAQAGASVEAIAGTIVDLGLASAMGSPDIELHYPLAAWAVMTDVAAGVTVYIRGDAPVSGSPTLTNVPHTVGFDVGAGRVIYTSFHQEPGINQQMERVLQLLMFEL